MDIHHKVVGVLHIVFGAIGLMIIAIVTLFFGVASSFVEDKQFPLATVAAFGAAVAGAFALIALVELVAGAMLLAGRKGAKPWVIGFGAMQLLNVPFGTALGIYTLWALLREQPTMVIVSTPTSLPR